MSEKEAWINLSDGGHIENMGVYELLRRRCKFIISIDGEADPQSTFQGHLTLVRHAQIDFGIRIEPDLTDLRPDLTSKYSQSHAMMCRVHYPAAGGQPGRPGSDSLSEAVRHRQRAGDNQALSIAASRLSAPDDARPVLRRGAVRGVSPARRARRRGPVHARAAAGNASGHCARLVRRTCPEPASAGKVKPWAARLARPIVARPQ